MEAGSKAERPVRSSKASTRRGVVRLDAHCGSAGARPGWVLSGNLRDTNRNEKRHMNATLDQLQSSIESARAEVRKVIIGQDRAIDLSLVVILTRSHALIEGAPGVAKTLLVRALARVLGGDFARIQFTPD